MMPTAVNELFTILEEQGVTLDESIKQHILTQERMQIVFAYVGFFNPNVSDEEFAMLRAEGEQYYKHRYQK
jgi:hypothetical protein